MPEKTDELNLHNLDDETIYKMKKEGAEAFMLEAILASATPTMINQVEVFPHNDSEGLQGLIIALGGLVAYKKRLGEEVQDKFHADVQSSFYLDHGTAYKICRSIADNLNLKPNDLFSPEELNKE